MKYELFAKSMAVIGGLWLTEKCYNYTNNKIHKEISQKIISTDTFPSRFRIQSFNPSKSKWNLDLTNSDFVNAIDNVKQKYSYVEIKTSKYPLETHLFIEYDEKSDTVKISFND